nr:hypothetical protein [Planctomycetota bacterium]
MLRHLAILPVLLAGGAAWCADSRAPNGPWTESFTMTLKDSERTFVVHNGASFLITKPEDFADRDFLLDKDILVMGKFERGQGDRISLYNLPGFEVRSAPELWSTRVDGDNLYLFGHVGTDAETGRPALRLSGIESAPSDGQIIANRLANIQKTDWDSRLATVTWAREQAAQQGNKEFWLQQSDTLLTKLVTDASAEAEAKQDFNLAQRAMDWCVDIQHDAIRAGRIGSMAWIRAKGGEGAEQVSKRMHRLGLEFYREQWRPRGESLVLEYDDRLAAISWKDADGFYKLGRWADANSEFMPQAKDRSYRAYQMGLRANPDHAGMRRELGLDVNSGETTADPGQVRLDYKDASTGVILKAPPGWRRSESINGDATWIDPKSETAYVSARFLQLPAHVDFNKLWEAQTATLKSRPGYADANEAPVESSHGQAKTLHYSFKEGNYKRLAEFSLVLNGPDKTAVILEASCAEEEDQSVRKAASDVLSKLVFPAAGPDGEAAPVP